MNAKQRGLHVLHLEGHGQNLPFLLLTLFGVVSCSLLNSLCHHGVNRSLNLIIDDISRVRALPPVEKIDSSGLGYGMAPRCTGREFTQPREYSLSDPSPYPGT